MLMLLNNMDIMPTLQNIVAEKPASETSFAKPYDFAKQSDDFNSSSDFDSDARNFEEITLKTGEKVKVARPSASDLEDPIHTEKTGTPKSITNWTKYILAGSMMRHLFKEGGDAIMSFDGAPKDDGFVTDMINRVVDFVGKKPEIQAKIDVIGGFFQSSFDGNLVNLTSLKDNPVYKQAIGIIESTGKTKDPHKVLQDAYSGFKAHQDVRLSDTPDIMGAVEGRADYKDFISNVESGLKKNQFGKTFDLGLGVTTGVITAGYALSIYRDIHRCFAETIAYEKYDERKKPSEITPIDIFTSENKIVKETCQNYIGKNALRFGVCAAFFGRWAGDALEMAGLSEKDNLQWIKHIPAGGITLGVLGVLMLTEMMRKDSSIFDDVVEMRDHKLNPQRGMGDSIAGSDLFDLYQKYCIKSIPNKMFKDATRSDYGDEGSWTSARAIFDRMAEMMNHTYKYKDSNFAQADPVLQIEREITARLEYFTLPKFIYLLGHDMIDFEKPELTLACAEIANTYSIQAAKQFWQKVEVEQVPIHDALEPYAVDLSKTLGSVSAEIDEVSRRSPMYREAILENYLQKNPDVQVKYNELVALRDEMGEQGKTPELSSRANIVMKDVRELLNNSKKSTEYDGELRDNVVVDNIVGGNGLEQQQKATPSNYANAVVQFGRMDNSVKQQVALNV